MDHAKCRLCGHRHKGLEHVWPDDRAPKVEKLVAGVTRGASNSLNNASNKESHASNVHVAKTVEKSSSGVSGFVPASGVRAGYDDSGGGLSGSCSETERARKQRWDRKAYNDYQREYMKKRRAGKKPLGIAHG